MKSSLFLVVVAFAVAALMAFRFREQRNTSSATPNEAYKLKNIVRCSPDWNALASWIEASDIPPIPGSGTHKWTIATKSDSAQFYFDQGMNMYYAFHIIESMASFKKAIRFDPECAMLYWAEALAYGPNINDYGYTMSQDAIAASTRAATLASNGLPKEKILIEAQRARYSDDTTQTREKLNQLYVDKMKIAYDKFGSDPDIAALYADALMLQHPWDLWNINGTPKPWTTKIRQVLEKILARTPNHTGANHYYIHVMEPSPYAALAIPSADRLGNLTPALSHTVHMPSHIYLRTGFYIKGAQVNETAVTSYDKMLPQYAPVSTADFLYAIHNLHMQTNHAMLAGRMNYSVQSSLQLVNRIPKDYLATPGAPGNVTQYIYMTPVFVDVRFGRWDELLKRGQPDSNEVYSNIIYHFGRGMAFAGQSLLTEAKQELERMQQLMKDSSLRLPYSPFSPAIDGAMVAESLLNGTIALKARKLDEAIDHFKRAVAIEELMVYNEPRDWLLNPGHYLGNALIKAGRFSEARKAFEKDLTNNKENGWALFGLAESLKGAKKNSASQMVMKRFNKAFEEADIKLAAAVF